MCRSVGGSEGHDDLISMLKSKDFIVICALYLWLAYIGMLSLELKLEGINVSLMMSANTSLRSVDGARYHKYNKFYAFKGRNTKTYRVSISMGAFINML